MFEWLLVGLAGVLSSVKMHSLGRKFGHWSGPHFVNAESRSGEDNILCPRDPEKVLNIAS